MRRRAWLAAGVSAAASVLVFLAPDAHAGSPASQVLVDAYGDSTTLGVTCSDGHCGPQAQNAVSYLQDELQARYGQKVRVTNYGVGGTMASQLRDGTGNRRAGPTAGLPWQERLAASSAQIVLINYGINEVMQNQTPEQFYAAETALVKTARALGKQPVLQTSNPMPDNQTLMSDGAHPKPGLYRLKAEQDFQVVDPLVRRLLDGTL